MTEQLIEQYSGMLSGLCMHLCQNRAEAEDLFQDTWEKVLKYCEKHSLANVENERAWLSKVCVNLYLDRARRHAREKCAEFERNEDKDAFLQNIPDPETRKDYSALYDALEALVPKFKSVIVLKYFYGYADSEIAQMLRIPEGTVRSRLHEGKRRLRSYLDE